MAYAAVAERAIRLRAADVASFGCTRCRRHRTRGAERLNRHQHAASCPGGIRGGNHQRRVTDVRRQDLDAETGRRGTRRCRRVYFLRDRQLRPQRGARPRRARSWSDGRIFIRTDESLNAVGPPERTKAADFVFRCSVSAFSGALRCYVFVRAPRRASASRGLLRRRMARSAAHTAHGPDRWHPSRRNPGRGRKGTGTKHHAGMASTRVRLRAADVSFGCTRCRWMLIDGRS